MLLTADSSVAIFPLDAMNAPFTEDAMSEMTAAELRNLLHYDPETGAFKWVNPPGYRLKPGAKAGCAGPNGRPIIVINRRNYYAARLAWLYMTGDWPEGQVSSENGDITDIRFANLRDRSHAEIIIGSRINSLNTSGIKGVSWNKTKARWVAHITRGGAQHYLGTFHTKEEAAAAYELAANGDRELVGGSKKDADWATSRRQRSAQWKDIQANPSIVGWDSLEAFVAELGEPPTEDHVLMRVRYDLPLGPGNVRWRLPWQKRDGHENDPQRAYNLGLKFDITVEEYNRLYAEQRGLCALCGNPETNTFRGKVRQLSVDHHHKDGYVRELLCFGCNAGLGNLRENATLMRAAADYIERHAKKFADASSPPPEEGK